jgi:hypothetical protein
MSDLVLELAVPSVQRFRCCCCLRGGSSSLLSQCRFRARLRELDLLGALF